MNEANNAGSQEVRGPVLQRSELVDPSAWLAPNATVIGEVHIAACSSIWYGAVLRGDTEQIRIGQATNIQDLACLHGDPGFPCCIGNRVTVGHGAIVHGAIVDDDCLIGIRAVLLNGARIGRQSIVGAGALITEGKQFPPRSLLVGAPARLVRELTDADLERIRHGSEHYTQLVERHRT